MILLGPFRLLSLTAALLLASPAGGQEELFKLLPSPAGPAGDWAGVSVALSGSRAVLGVPRWDFSAAKQDSGQVHVYKLSGGAWSLEKTFTPAVPALGGDFGRSVAIDGSLVGIGQPSAFTPGVVHLYKPALGGWLHVAELTASDSEMSADFGWSIAMQPGRVVVGAPFANELNGAVYVFQEGGLGWQQTARLTAGSDSYAASLFGTAVALSGDRILVGAPQQKYVDEVHAGAAYVFELQGSVWVKTQKLLAQTPVAFDRFGGSVALSGTTAVVGVGGADGGQGAVDVFSKPSAFFPMTHEARLSVDGAGASDVLGRSVAFDGTYLIAGSSKPGTGLSVGAAHVFTKGANGWIERCALVSQSGPSDSLGAAIAIHGSLALVSDPVDDEANPDAGAAYLFDLELVEPLGCTALNPAGSLVEVSGVPAIGTAWKLGVHNPSGTQAAGSFAFVALAGAPASPCGTAIPGWGMSAPGASAELLIALTPPPVVVGPAVWGGAAPATVSVPLPYLSTLVGLTLYTQGAMVGAPGSAVGVALTEGLAGVIGVPVP